MLLFLSVSVVTRPCH